MYRMCWSLALKGTSSNTPPKNILRHRGAGPAIQIPSDGSRTSLPPGLVTKSSSPSIHYSMPRLSLLTSQTRMAVCPAHALNLMQRLLRVPLRDDGKANIVPNLGRHNSYRLSSLSLTPSNVFLSPSDEYVAHFQLDWYSPFLGSSDNPNEPVEQMWMVLTSSLQNKRPLANQSRGLGPGENCLGLLLLPTGSEREFIKVGVWCYHLENSQGKGQWEGIQPQSIRIV